MFYEKISKLLQPTSCDFSWDACSRTTRVLSQDDGTQFTDKRNVMSRYRRKLPSTCRPFPSSFPRCRRPQIPVMDERTQTLPTVQYPDQSKEKTWTQHVQSEIRIYVFTSRYCCTGRNEIAAGNTHDWKEKIVNTCERKILFGIFLNIG